MMVKGFGNETLDRLEFFEYGEGTRGGRKGRGRNRWRVSITWRRMGWDR